MSERPTNVRLAKPTDAELLFALVRAADEEWSFGDRDDDKVRDAIWLATSRGEPPRPIFGVIEGANIIEGAVGLYPTERWNSRTQYLSGFFHFVHPLHRKSSSGKDLMRFGEWFADTVGMPLVWELLHPERTDAKVLLYERRATRIGGLFLYGPAERAA